MPQGILIQLLTDPVDGKYNDKEVFLDAYNANPSSMKVAIEGFLKKIAPIEPSAVCVVLVI